MSSATEQQTLTAKVFYGQVSEFDESLIRKQIANMERGKNTMIDMLLRHEFTIEHPPRFMFNSERNSFHVPFQTDAYKKWWAEGPTPITELKEKYGKFDPIQSKLEFRCEGKKRDWVIKYLLDLESKDKDPPYSAFENCRATFEIPFVTEKFKAWWEAPNPYAPNYKWRSTPKVALAEAKTAGYVDEHNTVNESME